MASNCALVTRLWVFVVWAKEHLFCFYLVWSRFTNVFRHLCLTSPEGKLIVFQCYKIVIWYLFFFGDKIFGCLKQAFTNRYRCQKRLKYPILCETFKIHLFIQQQNAMPDTKKKSYIHIITFEKGFVQKLRIHQLLRHKFPKNLLTTHFSNPFFLSITSHSSFEFNLIYACRENRTHTHGIINNVQTKGKKSKFVSYISSKNVIWRAKKKKTKKNNSISGSMWIHYYLFVGKSWCLIGFDGLAFDRSLNEPKKRSISGRHVMFTKHKYTL